MDQLKRRGWFLPNRCFLCKSEEESTNHLFLHCPKAAMIWQLIFLSFWCSVGYALLCQGNHN